MREDDWLDHEPLSQLVSNLTDDIVGRYRISESEAEQLIRALFASNQQLRQAAAVATTAAKLKRTRVFKTAASDAKRSIYYRLRTYRVDHDRLARFPDKARFDRAARKAGAGRVRPPRGASGQARVCRR